MARPVQYGKFVVDDEVRAAARAEQQATYDELRAARTEAEAAAHEEQFERAIELAETKGKLILSWQPHAVPLSERLFAIDSLTAFRIIGCDLGEVPDLFNECHTSVRSLHLPSNQLKSLPPSIRYLTSLRDCNLLSNEFATLPDTFTTFTKLTNLDLKGNKLTKLPRDFGNLRRLPKLSLSCNRLSSLPESMSAMRLSVLNLDSNHLEEIPEWFVELELLHTLSVNSNRIREFPSHLKDAPRLQHLRLSNNQISHIPDAPFGHFGKLRQLWLDWNPIVTLPLSVRFLTKLNELKAEGCPLKQPTSAFVCTAGAKGVVAWAHREREQMKFRQSKSMGLQTIEVFKFIQANELLPLWAFNGSESHTFGEQTDTYYNVVWAELTNLWPKVAKMWEDQQLPVIGEAAPGQPPTYSEQPAGTYWSLTCDELHHNLLTQTDAFGPVFRTGVWCSFERCHCEAEGREVCIPEIPGVQCTREASVLKHKLVSRVQAGLRERSSWELQLIEDAKEDARMRAEDYVLRPEAQTQFMKRAHKIAREDIERQRRQDFNTVVELSYASVKQEIQDKHMFRIAKLENQKQARLADAEDRENSLLLKIKYEKGWKRRQAEEQLALLQADRENGIEMQMIREARDEMAEELASLQVRIEADQAKFKPYSKFTSAIRNFFRKSYHFEVKRHFHRLAEEYVTAKVVEAEEQVRVAQADEQLAVMRKISSKWTGNNIQTVFVAWKGWYKQQVGTRRQLELERKHNDVLRAEEREAAQKLAVLEKAKWKRVYDEYLDEFYFQHCETGETRWTEPKDVTFVNRAHWKADAAERKSESSNRASFTLPGQVEDSAM